MGTILCAPTVYQGIELCLFICVSLCMAVCFLRTDGVIENLEALVLLVWFTYPHGMCLLKTVFNEVSVVTFQAVVASKLHSAFLTKS